MEERELIQVNLRFPAAALEGLSRLADSLRALAEAAGGVAAVTAFMGNSTRISTPILPNKRRFSSLVVSSLPSEQPKRTAGGGSNVKTQAARRSFRDRISSSSRLWPMCIPSNFPRATAVSCPSCISVVPAIISTFLKSLFLQKHLHGPVPFPVRLIGINAREAPVRPVHPHPYVFGVYFPLRGLLRRYGIAIVQQ